MRICLITLSLTPGGAERLVLEETNYLAEKGHYVSILTNEYDPDFVSQVGLQDSVELVPELPTGKVAKIRCIRRFCKENDIDMIESHYNDFFCVLATQFSDVDLSLHINGSPFWFSENNSLPPHAWRDGFEEYLNAFPGHKEYAYPQSITPIKKVKAGILEAARYLGTKQGAPVFTLTEQSANELEFLYDCEPIVIPPGVDASWGDNPDKERPEAFPDTEYVLFNVGRLDHRKRNQLLIDIVGDLRDDLDVGLVIGGSGEQKASLEHQITELDLDEVVSLPGYIPDNALPAYYANADVLAHPAWVAYGLVPLEAYLMGTKVAISEDTMVREIIEGEPAVSILPPEKDAWVKGLKYLLKSTEEPDPSILPTWEEFGEDKDAKLREIFSA